jgi:TolB-like protein/AraC-like DNA-binding protein
MADEILIDQVFLKKLTKILENNYSNEHFGVKELAENIPLNRSQLHRKLHAVKGVSASQFIREYRLQMAHKLLQSDVSTASEISYQVGFNSPTYFNTTFHEYYGYPPGEVKYQKSIANNKEDDIENIETEISRSKKNIVKQFKGNISKKNGFIIIAIIIFLIIGLSYNFYSDSLSKIIVSKSNNKKSIAVLPFKDMSKEGDSQWFGEGIVEDIITTLSKIEGLQVISRTSSKRYKNTDKTIPKIAKELRVSYVVEGSIRKEGNRVLITAKLISANDNQLMAENYNEKLEDIFKIQNDVAKKIVQQLKITISPQEKIAIKNYPTDNLEAYHLFLKGRLINNSRKKEDLELNIKLNKQAIALDSNFAEAYAEVGNSYFLMGSYGFVFRKEAKNKGDYYNDKALKIDPDYFRANAVKAMILWSQESKWQKSVEYYDKALASNPNDAATHLQYGRYFLYLPIPDYNKYLYYITIAQRLDPFSSNIGGDFFRALIINDKIEEAEQYQNKMGFLWSKEVDLSRKSLLKAYKNKDWKEAIRFFETEIDKDPNNSFLYNQIGHLYDEILNDDINFIKYSKKAYKLDSTNSSNAITYFNALVEGKKFATAHKLMKSDNFKSLIKKKQQLSSLWYFYYHQENYKKAQDILKDSLMEDDLLAKLITQAQLGGRKSVDSMLSFSFSRTNSYKIFIHAILKERDSMYHYLEKASYRCGPNYRIMPRGGGISGPNNRREFDPYRKEERYKAFLKKNYLPLTHWNE